MGEVAGHPDTSSSVPYVFVSYASADRERVLPVVAALQQAGVPVWIDREGIHGGANYGEEIAQAIKGSAALVLMTSAAALTSRNVKQEIALAWEHERPYVPLLLDVVTIPIDLQYWLTAAQWIEVLENPEWEWLPVVIAALAPLGITPARHEDAIPLAGREREFTLLREKLAAVNEGKGGLVLIGGEAGIGKTTLADALLREAAQQGAMVLTGHCFDLAETPPYGPWIDLFAHAPTTFPLPPAFAERGTVGAVTSQMALFVQVEDCLTALTAARRVVLLLDDLHWSDPASLDLLRYLARSVAALPLLILVTYRSDELTRRHPLYPLLPQLAREAGALRIDLGSLAADAVRSLVTERYHLPDDATARLTAYVQARAEGNALFVGELLRSLEEAGTLRREGDEWRLGNLAQAAVPALLRQVIDGRLARLGEESKRLLAVAAVIGHEVPLEVWATVTGVDEDDLTETIEAAMAAYLMEETPDGRSARFVHALIREAIYEGILPSRRRGIHRHTGEAIAAMARPDPDAVAHHFQMAGDERAVAWLVQAGEAAQWAYAWQTAADRFEAALALMEREGGGDEERAWLLFRLSRTRRYSDPHRAIAYLDDALQVLAATDDAAAARANFLRMRGLYRCLAGDVLAGVADMEAGIAALAVLPEADRRRVHDRARSAGISSPDEAEGPLVLWYGLTGRTAEARTLGERMLASQPMPVMTSGVDSSGYGNGYEGLGAAYAALGFPAQARSAYDMAQASYWAVGLNSSVGSSTVADLAWAVMPYYTDHIAERQRLAQAATDAYRRAAGVGLPEEYVRSPYLILLFTEGGWADAGVIASAVRASGQGHTRPFTIQVASIHGTLAAAQGDSALAWDVIREALPKGAETAPGASGFLPATALQRVAAHLALEAGDPALARTWLSAHEHWLTWSGAALGQSEGQVLWAQYHRQTGDAKRAHTHAERALAHATEPRQPLALLAAHRLLGELDTDAGRFADAATHLHASLALADACQAPYERALTLLAMAVLRAMTGQTSEAEGLLAEVRTLCEPLGAKPALARVDALAEKIAAEKG